MCISTSCRPFNHTPTPLCRPVITDALSDPSPTTFLFAIDHMSRTYTNISKTHSSVLSWIMLFPRKMVLRTQLFPTHAFSIFFFFFLVKSAIQSFIDDYTHKVTLLNFLFYFLCCDTQKAQLHLWHSYGECRSLQSSGIAPHSLFEVQEEIQNYLQGYCFSPYREQSIIGLVGFLLH